VKSAGVVSAAALSAVLFGLGFLPLLGGFRYEAALAAGLLAPAWAACATLHGGRRRAAERWQEGAQGTRVRLDWADWAVAPAAWHALAILVAAGLHDAVRGSCEFLPGLALFLLGPVLGTVLGATFGAAVATLTIWSRPRSTLGRRALVLLAPLGPLLTALFAVGEFASGPAIYAYDPFAGYFAGPLYDTIPFDLPRLAVFRVGTLLTLSACWLWGRSAWLDGSGRPTPRLSVPASPSLVLAASLSLASLGHAALAPQLGLATTTSSLAQELSGRARHGRCSVHHSPWVSPKVARRIAWECAAHVRQLRGHFELVGEGPMLTVQLFANAAEKGRLMGARTTYLAKPWRREVYLQVEAFPHPVLRHELAHAVAAEFGAGLFRASGTWFGLLPDPGRIEGFAVAAAPAEEGDATEAQWARALLDLGQLPPSVRLFSLGFLGSAAIKSYTSAGAFVDHLHRRYGAAVMKAWYAGGDLERLTGKSWGELDLDYRQELAKVSVSPRVRALAEEIFSRPSLFGRRCPHAADRALERAHALCPVNAGAAQQELERALELDPTRRDAEGLLPSCFLSAGEPVQAEAKLAALRASSTLSGRERVRALVMSADLAWVHDRPGEARAAYDAVLQGALTSAEARSVGLKRWALDRPEPVSSAVRRYLAAGEPGGSDPAARLAALFDWHRSGPDRGVAAYLLGLQLLEGDPIRGRALLEQALMSGELEGPYVVEAERRLLLLACLEGDLPRVQVAAKALSEQHHSAVQAARAVRLGERCQGGAPL
jgi:hypothetical protein